MVVTRNRPSLGISPVSVLAAVATALLTAPVSAASPQTHSKATAGNSRFNLPPSKKPLILPLSFGEGLGRGPRALAVSGKLRPRLAAAVKKPTATRVIMPPTPAPPPLQGNTLFLVGYAHLDTQWRWTYPQVIREFIPNTMTNNFRLFDKYPDYIFNFSGSRRYEMMKEYYPADYARVKEYVKKGQWFPCGSSVDEGDANVPSSEALIRHTLYGNHFFRRELGVASDEFMLPDCFGFPYALPTVLAHCGITAFSTQKLTWGSAVGIPFKVGTWEGPDGRSIVAALDPGGYTGGINEDLSRNTSWLARILNTGKDSGAYVDYHYYGAGDRGGAPAEDAVQWMEKSLAGTGPIHVVSSKADDMVHSLSPNQIAKLPHYKGELLLVEHSAGSITSQAYMKRWNRKNELLADAAEKASVAAMWLGGAPYPSDRLYNAWDLVLGSQMHDMLPGTSLPRAYDYCWNDELLALNQFAAVTQDAVGAVSSALDTRVQGVPLVVYNPLSISRQDVVQATVPLTAGQVQVYGPDGKPVLTQVLERSADTAKIAFLATAPATGYAVYDIRPAIGTVRTASARAAHISSLPLGRAGVGASVKGGAQSSPPPGLGGRGAAPAPSLRGGVGEGTLKVSARTVENDRFRVTMNADGDIASIYDKRSRREVLKAPARLDLQYENPAQYPAWNMDWDDAKKAPRGYVHGPATFRIVESGPVRVALEVTRETGGSRFVQQIRLSSGSASDRVEVLNKIDWRTPETALKASFPLAAGNPKATYDLQVGTIERGNNDPKKYEVPQHQWFDLTGTDGRYGTGILNDCKFGSDKPDDNTVRLTLIYTPGTRGGYQDQGTQDIGRHEILYAIAPHAGNWSQGGVPWQAKRLNQPLLAFTTTPHAGALGRTFSLAALNTAQVQIEAIKKAEDTGEVIVRLRELEGKPAHDVQIRMAGAIVAAHEVDGQERPIGAARIADGVLTTDVPAYGLKAFALTLARPAKPANGTWTQPVPLQYNLDAVSTDARRTDGAFDYAGRTFAAEQLPATVTADGIPFKMGPTKDGAKNALICQGQTIKLPPGTGAVYVLAAATKDTPATFRVGGTAYRTTVQSWGGFVGQWDHRFWSGVVPELTYDWHNPYAGLEPGYVKTGEVAWFSSHRHAPAGNEAYEYSYLFKYGFPATLRRQPATDAIKAGGMTANGAGVWVTPESSGSITLPNDPRIRVFAITAARAPHDTAIAAQPLYDTLRDHVPFGSPEVAADPGTGPTVPAKGAVFHDAISVSLKPPFYWRDGGLRYTLDGSGPTAASPVYTEPFTLNRPATIKAAEFSPAGKPGPVSTEVVTVNDTTAPKVVSANALQGLPTVMLRFSEAVQPATAEDAANYRISTGTAVKAASLAEDGKTVELNLAAPIAAGDLTLTGVKDMSPAGNAAAGQVVPLTAGGRVFASPAEPIRTKQDFKVDDLPIHAKDPWTINLFCLIDKQPPARSIVAGFGRVVDGENGRGRYITNFATGIHFWSAQRDVDTGVPFDIGKWQMITATYDGRTLRVYKNGAKIGEKKVDLADDTSAVHVLPVDAWDRTRVVSGQVRDFTIWNEALSPSSLQTLWEAGK